MVSDFSSDSGAGQGGPGPFPPQDDDPRGSTPPAGVSSVVSARPGNGSGPASGHPGAHAPALGGPGGASAPGAGTGPGGPIGLSGPGGPGGPAAGATSGPGSPGGPGGPGASGGPGPSNFASVGSSSMGPPRLAPVVKGRIEVADEVVEKVAGLAVIEVEGVADLGGDFERALESVRDRIGIGHKRGDQGIKARITGREVSLDVVIMVEYGHVVMEVARNVQANVAVQTNRMLGLNVVEVNVTVDDVKLPQPEKPEKADAYDGGYGPEPEPYPG